MRREAEEARLAAEKEEQEAEQAARDAEAAAQAARKRIRERKAAAEQQRKLQAAARRKKAAASKQIKDATDRQLRSEKRLYGVKQRLHEMEPSGEPEPYPEERLRFFAEAPWNSPQPQEPKKRGMLVREIATKVSLGCTHAVTCDACRYLCAFTWSLRDKLRDGEPRDDILSLILGKEEAAWVTSQRSRPLAVLSRLRRLVYSEYQSNSLDSQLFYFLETDSKRHASSNAGSPR